MMDDDDAIFLPEKSANNRRIQPLIPDGFGRQTLIFIDLLYTVLEEFANLFFFKNSYYLTVIF